MLSFYSLSYSQLQQLSDENGLSPETSRRLFTWHYKKNKHEPCRHNNLSPQTQEWIQKNLNFQMPTIASLQLSVDKTVKFQIQFQDKMKVESVLIPFQGKYSLCVSSQVGCAMNCSFCFTGKQGWTRHLTTAEIVTQLLVVQKWLTEQRPEEDWISNVVFMGQGEPLHNFDAVKTAAEIFMSQHGLSIAGEKITVSTSGYLPGLLRWKQEMPKVNLALSLHSPFPEKRDQLIPINKKYPLHEVLKVIQDIPLDKKRFVTYEYLLIKDFNDQEEDAKALGQSLQGQKALLNLIPFNPFPGSPYQRPSQERVQSFSRSLEIFKIPTMIRKTKGEQILAACGQLNTVSSISNTAQVITASC